VASDAVPSGLWGLLFGPRRCSAQNMLSPERTLSSKTDLHDYSSLMVVWFRFDPTIQTRPMSVLFTGDTRGSTFDMTSAPLSPR